jgi:5-formyltetrahydrofolate cyclo-ligase
VALSEGELVRGTLGFAQPAASAPLVAVEAVDVFVVPGLLFDRACRRLGRGRGDYDRLLARARPDALRVGICYADRVVDELPEDPWDVAMDVVVTDRFVLRRAAAGEAR